MSNRVDLYSSYGQFTDPVLAAVRKETFGVDLGQNSWTTMDEYERFIEWLALGAGQHVLEIASGSGGPALFLARVMGCRVTGIDADENGVATATELAARADQTEQVRFAVADATARLPFETGSFDGLICIDAMNHFPDRAAVLREWHRVLRAGGRAVFTDPVVISGPVTGGELAVRGSIGRFLFVPSGCNEGLIEQAGFRVIRAVDASEDAAVVAGRWHDARWAHRDELLQLEGEERFDGLQRFFETVHRLTRERRLSRIAYVAEKPGA